MNAEIAKVAVLLMAVNAAAAVVMIPLALGASALALDGLEKFDLWLRCRSALRPHARSEGTEVGRHERSTAGS